MHNSYTRLRCIKLNLHARTVIIVVNHAGVSLLVVGGLIVNGAHNAIVFLPGRIVRLIKALILIARRLMLHKE